jgi:hypothetical protein
MSKQEKVDVQELEKRFVELGGSPTHYQFKRKVEAAQALAIEQYEHETSQAAIAETKRPTWAKVAGERAGKGLAYVSTFFTFLFVLGGLLVGTFVLIAAELTAVYVGFSVMDSAHAPLYSVALVLFYVVVLFIQEMIIDKRGYTAQKKASLRLMFEDAMYFLGIGKTWQMRYNELPSAQQNISITVKLSTWAIIIFGVLGRLQDKISDPAFANITWHEAIKRIVLDSSLSDFVGYVGMFIATAALLWSTKWIVVFIYEQFRRVTGGVMIQDFSNASISILSPVEMIEAQTAKVYQSEILRLEAKNKKSE